MPIDPVTGTLIIGGLAAAASGGQLMSQANMNKKTRAWNEKMYGVQRKDALADWNAQNLYNSPAAQMQRLKEAGLNPNLVYGHGADAQGGIIRNTESKGWNPEAPDVASVGSAVSGAFSQYYDTRVKEATINNMQTNNEIMQKEVAIKDATARAIELGIVDKTWELNYKTENKLVNQETLKAKLDNIIQGTQASMGNLALDKIKTELQLSQFELQKVMAAQTFEKTIEEMANLRANRAVSQAQAANIRQNTENLIKDGTLKQFEITLNEKGITKNDPIYWRIANQVIEKVSKGGDLRKSIDEVLTEEGREKMHERLRSYNPDFFKYKNYKK